MAPKRLKKSFTNEDNGKKYQNLSISDALCPICRSIIIEPVTLPCSHSFCLACFNGTVENATLTCPLCRTRIGSWLRLARKGNKIVDNLFWNTIQTKFPNEVRKRLNGDDILVEDDDTQVNIKIADPGEIRREYELQLETERSTMRKERDTEEKASAIVIKKILEEEKEAARQEEEKLRLDEEVAKRLAAENGLVVQKTPQKSATKTKKSSIDKYLISLGKRKQASENNIKPEIKSISKKEQTEAGSSLKLDSSAPKKIVKNYSCTIMCQSRPNQKCHKPLQHLLLAKTLQCERANSNESGDSIKQEMRYFKPIRLAPAIDKYQDGKIVHIPLLKLPTVHARTNSSAVIRSPQINRTTLISTHPKSAFVSLNSNVTNDPCNFTSPIKQPSVINESGKIIKQYYNKKRNALFTKKQSCTITSLTESPFLGFEMQHETKHITILNDFIHKLSQNVQVSENQIPVTKVLNVPSDLNIFDNKNKTFNAFNGYKPVKKNSSKYVVSNELNIQEQLDLEFAKRLHEELNNPRQTRASVTNKKLPSQTRSSPRKRQVKIDELLTPKKFKI